MLVVQEQTPSNPYGSITTRLFRVKVAIATKKSPDRKIGAIHHAIASGFAEPLAIALKSIALLALLQVLTNHRELLSGLRIRLFAENALSGLPS